MRTRRRFGVAVLGAALALLLAGTGRADAAFITWGPATTISGDTDVDTKGNLVAAFNLGNVATSAPPLPAVMDTTVNGVPFVGLAIPTGSAGPVSDASGNFTFDLVPTQLPGVGLVTGTFSSLNGVTSTMSPFASLSSSYQDLLSSLAGGQLLESNPSIGQAFSLTMKGLTVGHTYEFEWWSNASQNSTATSTTATAGNSVMLEDNTKGSGTGGDGGVGQFAIGKFTADGTSEVITFTGASPTSGPHLNGLELRDLGPAAPTAVPEPASLTLLGIGALGLLGYGWRKRKQAA
jgi:hypothetical protein